MIQFARLKSTANVNNVVLEQGQPLVDLKNSYLYIGKESTNKLKFYDSAKIDRVESNLSTRISNLNSSLSTEVSDRKSGDQTLTESINTEISRAKGAEKDLTSQLTDLDTYVKTKTVNSTNIISKGISDGTVTETSVKVSPINGQITFTSGMNVQLTVKDDSVIEISSQNDNTTYNLATKNSDGLMSSTDFIKLQGIAEGANKYELPPAKIDVLGGVKLNGLGIISEADGKFWIYGLCSQDKAQVSLIGKGTDNANPATLIPGTKYVDIGTTDSPFKNINCTAITSTGNIVSEGGTITANSFNARSDKRLKENIIDYKPEKSILDLPVKKFDFINGPKNQIGCIAQDLKEICPEVVNEDEKGYLSIQESKLVYLLLDEMKKLKQDIKALELRVNQR